MLVVATGVFGALSRNLSVPAYVSAVVIASGAVSFITSLLGCVGVLRDSPRLLAAFFGIMMILVLADIAILSLGFALRADAYGLARETWQYLYTNDPLALEQTQDSLACCGFSSASDMAPNNECPSNAVSGCDTEMTRLLSLTMLVVGCAGIFVAAVQITGLALALVIRRAVTFRINEELEQQSAVIRKLFEANPQDLDSAVYYRYRA